MEGWLQGQIAEFRALEKKTKTILIRLAMNANVSERNYVIQYMACMKMWCFCASLTEGKSMFERPSTIHAVLEAEIRLDENGSNWIIFSPHQGGQLPCLECGKYFNHKYGILYHLERCGFTEEVRPVWLFWKIQILLFIAVECGFHCTFLLGSLLWNSINSFFAHNVLSINWNGERALHNE